MLRTSGTKHPAGTTAQRGRRAPCWLRAPRARAHAQRPTRAPTRATHPPHHPKCHPQVVVPVGVAAALFTWMFGRTLFVDPDRQ